MVDWEEDGVVLFAFLAVAVGMMILSLRRGLEATVLLATLAAETALAFLMYAISLDGIRPTAAERRHRGRRA